MRRILKKIISSFLVLILILSNSSIFFHKNVLAESSNQEKVQYQTLEEYITTEGEKVYGEFYNGDFYLGIKDVTILDFSYVNNLQGITYIIIENSDIGNVKDVTLPSTLKTFEFYDSCFKGILSFQKCTNLEKININLKNNGDLSQGTIDLRGLENIKSFDYLGADDSEIYEFDRRILMDTKYSLAINKNCNYYDGEKIYRDYSLRVYENMTEFSELKFNEEKDITELWISNTIIKDFSDISEFTKLKKLTISGGYIQNLSALETLEQLEELDISVQCIDEGTYTFTNNKNLKSIHFETDLAYGYGNVVVDIRGMDWLDSFSYRVPQAYEENFDIEKYILVDDQHLLSRNSYLDGIVWCSFYYYDTVEEYIERQYGTYVNLEEMEELQIIDSGGIGMRIRDLEGIKNLQNLKFLNIAFQELENTEFLKALSNLEKLSISNCTLNGSIDLTDNINLTFAYIELDGNLSNSVVNIEGLRKLEHFTYVFEKANKETFDLKTNIKTDLSLNFTEEGNTCRYYRTSRKILWLYIREFTIKY